MYPFICIPFPAVFITTSLRIGGAGTVEIYVAPIEEDMLLGLDFLEANGVSLHLKEKELQIAGDVIPMCLGTSKHIFKLA
jgi:hypothetical protein